MKLRPLILRRSRWILFLVLPAISFCMNLPVFPTELGGVHAWRQCETASNVAIFHEQHPPIYNPHVYHLDFPDGLKRMEFPIMQYVMALGWDLFGESVWVLRIVSWFISVAAIWGMFFWMRQLFQDEWTALLGAWCYAFSPVLFYYSVNPMPDNLALAAGIWGLGCFTAWYRTRRPAMLWWGAFALMLSTLAKLPFIIYYMLPLAFLVQDSLRSRFRRTGQNFLRGLPFLILLIPAAAWYAWVVPTWENGVVTGILGARGDDWGEIAGILGQTLISILPELLINYAALPFFLYGLWRMGGGRSRSHELFVPMLAWAGLILVYYAFEINMIGTAHDYYLFPFLPGIFLIVGFGAGRLSSLPRKWALIFSLVVLLALPVTAALRSYPRRAVKGTLADLLNHREALREAVPREARIIVGHDRSPHIFLYHLGHFGWSLDKDQLHPDQIRRAMEGGAAYFYSADRDLEQHELIRPLLGEQVAEHGTFRVFRILR